MRGSNPRLAVNSRLLDLRANLPYNNPFTLQGGLTCFLSRPLQDVLVAQALAEKPLVEVGIVVGWKELEPLTP